MKAILSFKLPEEKSEYEIYSAAVLNYSIICDISDYLRHLNKYDDRESIPKDELSNKLRELLSEFEM